MNVAKRNRWGHRDATMLFVAFRHGLRASELVDLRWDQIEFKAASSHIRRAKHVLAPAISRSQSECHRQNSLNRVGANSVYRTVC
jgi:integrase